MKKNIVILNGHVIDPANNIDRMSDVFISDGNIVGGFSLKNADIVIDASGKYVFPGLIDYHAHVFPKSTDIGINADISMLNQGVTSVVDPGSSGISNLETFIEEVIRKQTISIQAYVNLCPAGLITMKYHESYDPKYWDIKRIERFFKKYPDVLLGLKIRISKEIIGEYGFEILEKAIGVAEALGTRICVHTTNPAGGMARVASILRKGDILAHCFHGTGSSIIGEDGHVLPAVLEARKRGVIMDAANGGNHWSFTTAEAAMRDGFYPDIISTDLTCKTLYKEPVFSLPHVMSKYLMMDMNLFDIVKSVTAKPASLMHDKDGSLSEGTEADVAIFDIIEKNITFVDTQKEMKIGHQTLVPLATICKGEIVYRTPLFS